MTPSYFACQAFLPSLEFFYYYLYLGKQLQVVPPARFGTSAGHVVTAKGLDTN